MSISKKEFFRQSAFYLLILGMLGTVASYFAGTAAGGGMEAGALNKAMELHEQAATLSLWLSIITVLLYAGLHFSKYKRSWLRMIAVLMVYPD